MRCFYILHSIFILLVGNIESNPGPHELSQSISEKPLCILPNYYPLAGVDLRKKINWPLGPVKFLNNWPLQNSTGPRNIVCAKYDRGLDLGFWEILKPFEIDKYYKLFPHLVEKIH
jgi:hypothetical protein